MLHVYRYVLKQPFRQDGHWSNGHDRLNIDQQLPYHYTDNYSRYLFFGHLSLQGFQIQHGRKSREANNMEMSSRPVHPMDTKHTFTKTR